jgi:hypothetical protein
MEEAETGHTDQQGDRDAIGPEINIIDRGMHQLVACCLIGGTEIGVPRVDLPQRVFAESLFLPPRMLPTSRISAGQSLREGGRKAEPKH